MLYEELSRTVIGAAMEAHKLPESGFLESVYERAPALELTGRRIPFERQAPIAVMHKQAQVVEYRADFLVDGKINPEIKAPAALSTPHSSIPIPACCELIALPLEGFNGAYGPAPLRQR